MKTIHFNMKFFILFWLFVSLLVLISPSRIFASSIKKSPSIITYKGCHYISVDQIKSHYGLQMSLASPHLYLESGKNQIRLTAGSKRFVFNDKQLYTNHEVLFKRRSYYLSIGDLVTYSNIFQLRNDKVSNSINIPIRIRKILIDPGHGGKDDGTSPKGVKEKDLVLVLGKLLLRELNRAGFEAYMTRYSDRFIPLNHRVGMAKQGQFDLFISLHANYSDVKKVSGMEFFVGSKFKGNPHVKKALENLPKHKSFKRFMHRNLAKMSYRLAKKIEERFLTKTPLRSRGIKTSEFRVLRKAYCPAIIFELGFLSNPKDSKWINDRKNLKLASELITEAIFVYAKKGHKVFDA